MSLEQQKINAEILSVTSLGLHPETELILQNKVSVWDIPTDKEVDKLVSHFCQILFQKDVDSTKAFGWVLSRFKRDLTDLSYFVTTREGARFRFEYEYLHKVTATLFAHSYRFPGNAFYVYGGESFLNQFPNEFHRGFIQGVINGPKTKEDGVKMHGGILGSEFVYHAKGYVANLGNLSDTLNPANAELAQRMAFFGITLPGGRFLREISPVGVDDREPKRAIAKLYRENVPAVREILFSSATTMANAGTVLELIGEYFSEKNNLDYYGFFRVFDLLETLRNVSGKGFVEYQKVILKRMAEIRRKGWKVPAKVVEAVKWTTPFS